MIGISLSENIIINQKIDFYKTEIEAMKPIIINKDLTKIKNETN